MKLAFFRNIFEKYTDIYFFFFENPSRGAEFLHSDRGMEKTEGQTDRDKHDEANSHFRNCVNITKITRGIE